MSRSINQLPLFDKPRGPKESTRPLVTATQEGGGMAKDGSKNPKVSIKFSVKLSKDQTPSHPEDKIGSYFSWKGLWRRFINRII